MKFDAARVADDIVAFSVPRFAGSSGETRARDELASRFGAVGWRQSQISEVMLKGFRTWQIYLSWVGLLAIPCVSARLMPIWFRATAVGLVLMTMAFARSKPHRTSAPPNVMAWSAGASGMRPRLVVLTRLETPKPGWSDGRWVLVTVIATAANLFSLGLDTRWKFFAFIIYAMISVLLIVPPLRPFRNRRGVGSQDNRTGLALLSELSRCLPRSVTERLDVFLIGIGGGVVDHPEAVTDIVVNPPSDQPRLLIILDSPAVGPVVRIASASEGVLAKEIAEDLRIPHQLDLSRFVDSSLNLPFVRITGDQRKSSEIEPRLFQPTLHLIGEIALRWAKTKSS